MPQLLRPLTGIALMFCALQGLAKTDSLEAERSLFLEARKALQHNQTDRYRSLASKLKDYPLYPYLQFQELRTRLSRAEEPEIARFLETYADQLVALRLKQSWLYNLARHQRWQLFLDYYTPSASVELQCYALQARLNTGQRKGLAEDILPLWLVGKSQPKACDPLFDYLYDGDYISEELLWQRIRLAMQSNRPSLAGYLARRLPAQDADWVSLWRKAHTSPSSTLDDPRLDRDSQITREIIVHAMRRLALFDAAQAHEKWRSFTSAYQFSAKQRADVEQYIALRAATQHRPEAHEWMRALPLDVDDEQILEWRIRTALVSRDWKAVEEYIHALPPGLHDADEWRYWLAFSQKKTGQHLAAVNLYAFLAKERSYYGFLAADQLDWPNEMGHTTLDYDPAALEELRTRPALMRAHELYRANLLTDARREWAHATRNMDNQELKLASVLAREWGWNDRAILTIARTGDFSDLKLRFPLDHAESVNRYARSNRLDPGLVFAVIRQESAFNKDARSSAGAMGLMQLMPSTGKLTARQNRIPLKGTQSLFDIEKNIHIGTTYLRQMMERFDGNPVLAAAAYNAGPHRVQRWLPDEGSQVASTWVANIPFRETRKYVQRVLTYGAIYDWRMDRTITPLQARMPTVIQSTKYARNTP